MKQIDEQSGDITQLRDLAARFARILLKTLRPLQSERAGNAGMGRRIP
jgi:hypothetical protein